MFAPLFLEKYTINIFAPGDSDDDVKSQFLSFLKSNFWPVNIDMMEAKINFIHFIMMENVRPNKFIKNYFLKTFYISNYKILL